MQNKAPIEFLLGELSELIHPDPVEDVLEVLAQNGLISEYFIGKEKVFVWTAHDREIELHLFMEKTKNFEPTPKQRKK